MRFAIIGTGAMGLEHLRNIVLMGEKERAAAKQEEAPVAVAALCDSTPQSLEWARMTLTLSPEQGGGYQVSKARGLKKICNILPRNQLRSYRSF